jgi:hypothetical protein
LGDLHPDRSDAETGHGKDQQRDAQTFQRDPGGHPEPPTPT